jgi:hypothetical protein
MSSIIVHLQHKVPPFDSEEIINVPSPLSWYLLITHVDSPDAHDMSVSLYKAITKYLHNLPGTETSAAPINGLASPYTKGSLDKYTAMQKLLIIVSDGKAATLTWEGITDWEHPFIPVMPQDNFKALPAPFNINQIAMWRKNVREMIPELMAHIGIGTDFRIFISYRRDDTSPLAEQLFTELTKNRFEVFLDRFSIDVGINFQQRLQQELSDKSMMLMLESTTYLESNWVDYEIAFAKKYRLGLYAFNIDHAPRSPAVSDDLRKMLDNTYLNTGGTIRADKLNELTQKIKEEHAFALFRKKYYLQNNIIEALRHHHVAAAVDARGFIEAKDDNRKNDYRLWAVPRPAEIDDFHYTDSCHSGTRNFIIGPEFIESDRAAINKWLSSKCVIGYIEEGTILTMAHQLKQGTL